MNTSEQQRINDNVDFLNTGFLALVLIGVIAIVIVILILTSAFNTPVVVNNNSEQPDQIQNVDSVPVSY